MNSPEDDAAQSIMEDLRRQVDALQQTLRRMEGGGVDAVMIGDAGAETLYELTSPDRPYRVIVEAMGEGAATVSVGGHVLYANPQLADFLGVAPGSLAGGDLAPHVAPASLERLQELLVSEDKVRRAEVEMLLADGTTMPFLVAASDLDLDGTLVRCLVFTDLTTQKAYERQLVDQVAADERHRVAQEVNDTIVQGLVAAEMSLDLGNHERAREQVARTSHRARSWIGELAGDEELRPGMALRRLVEQPTDGGTA